MNDVELDACVDKRGMRWRYWCFPHRIRMVKVVGGVRVRRGSGRKTFGKRRVIEGVFCLGLVGTPKTVATTRRRASESRRRVRGSRRRRIFEADPATGTSHWGDILVVVIPVI